MGHIRLGNLPRTRKWQQVVALIEGGAGTAQVANATIAAAEQGLNLAAEDKGLVETIWLLTQLPLAARGDDFGQALQSTGLDVSDSPGLMEVIGAFSDAIDKRLANNGGRTDLGEMAQMAASETMADIIGSRTQSLFGTTSDDVKNAFSKLATNKQFSIFARDFFSRLTNKCLDYFVSRATAHHVGEGRRFRTLAQQGEFTKALGTHSREASKIIEAFSGGWFSKTNWEKKGISRQDAAGFAHVAMKKIVAELKEGARTDG
jgi:hypothetical protein